MLSLVPESSGVVHGAPELTHRTTSADEVSAKLSAVESTQATLRATIEAAEGTVKQKEVAISSRIAALDEKLAAQVQEAVAKRHGELCEGMRSIVAVIAREEVLKE